MNRTIVLHSAAIIWWLCRWTTFALYDVRDEALAKPWRPWARLAFSAVITVLLLGTHVLVVRRARLL